MKKDELEDLFKKSFENYEADVRPGVWKNVKIGLKWGGLAVLINTILNKLGINAMVAILTSVIAVVSTVVVMTWNHKVPETTTVAEKTVQLRKMNEVPSPANIPVNNKEQSKEIAKTDVNAEAKNTEDGQKTKSSSSNTVAESGKKDTKKIEPLIAKLSEGAIASISASPAGGTVPLIVSLENTGTGKVNKWTFSDGKKVNTASNPVHVFETPGIYSVILTSSNANGKTGTDSIKVEVTANSSVKSVPKEFSPNGDGVLDVFVLQSKNIVNMNAKIVDKKGNIVYKSEGIDARWDGNDLKGNPVQEGTYFYLINAEGVDGKKYEQKGSVNLKR